jgi:electron transport complex protein RnfC
VQTARVVTVAGEHVPRPGNYYVPFGMDCRELTGAGDRPIIHGGPMVGYHLADGAVVGPGTNALLAIDESPPAVPTPCIRCGWCTSHCPARLNVAVLNDAFELGDLDRAHRLGARACLACGVCSYICPARLPLAQRVKQLLHLIAQTRRDRAAREAISR